MDGIPVTLKDNIETAAPMHTTAGAEILLNHIAARDAPLVAQLRAGGFGQVGHPLHRHRHPLRHRHQHPHRSPRRRACRPP